MTQFVSATLPLWDGMQFYLDGNSKITAGNGTYESPVPNAFSLPDVTCCPGSTEACRSSCYVQGLREKAPEIYRNYTLNAAFLHRILMSYQSMSRAAKLLGHWIDDNAAAGFRWHVSGDVMGDRHADWIVMVCDYSPQVRHWIYTRTFQCVQCLIGARNLTVNISADRDNITEARAIKTRFPNTRICYLAQEACTCLDCLPELPQGSVIFPDYPNRGREMAEPTEHEWWLSLWQEQRAQVCPADFFGQSKQHRCGPCNKCMVKPLELVR